MNNRDGEVGEIPVRSGRFFCVNNEWFVSTREGKPIGPFASEEEAKVELNNFIDFISIAEPELLAKYFTSFFQENTEHE